MSYRGPMKDEDVAKGQGMVCTVCYRAVFFSQGRGAVREFVERHGKCSYLIASERDVGEAAGKGKGLSCADPHTLAQLLSWPAARGGFGLEFCQMDLLALAGKTYER